MNERAAVLGQLGKAQERAESFDRAARRWEELRAKAVFRREDAEQAAAEKLRTLQALDVSIALVDSRVRSDAAGRVVPWKDKYGTRGALSSYIRAALRDAAPQPISGAELTNLATAHFNLKLLTPPERKSFRDTVKSVLRLAVQRDGVVERLQRTSAKQRNQLYRWKGPTSLASLRAWADAVQEPEREPGENPARPQVAAQ
ncbi:MAG: hypothetical protein U1E02_01815 [Hydrogenophaga sp.]|uniref:hypothetical protein n=1 Tax=Hydrogenophaga sp. TaxID=1904254 RepID=UPI0027320E5A|nr:hypothetical protein [Hydrogenophaga sp.]MDP2249426.1 hypothetical protein [Hydrogenophaga sp.]MDZ4122903.1 hypothetical protein [Hydrogenophaga sp.]